MKSIIRTLSIAVFTATIAISCTKDDQNVFDRQEASIESFVNSFLGQYPEASVTRNGGATSITAQEGSGQALDKKGKATLRYIAYKFNGNLSRTNIVATNDIAIAKEAGLDTTYAAMFEPVTISPSDKDIVRGLSDGLIGVRQGEERIILFNGKFSFQKKVSGMISAKSPMAYHILVEGISN